MVSSASVFETRIEGKGLSMGMSSRNESVIIRA